MKPISRHCAFASSTHTKCPTFAWSHTRGKAVQCYCTCLPRREARRCRMTRRDIPCDWCRLMNSPCPGTIAHCQQGHHCWEIEASCAAAWTYDPCTHCCSCKTLDPKPYAGAA